MPAPTDAAPTLWEPTAALLDDCNLTRYRDYLRARGEAVAPDHDYEALWRWSVDDIDRFWSGLLEYFSLETDGSATPVRSGDGVEDAAWFPDLRLNYAEHSFRRATADRPALISIREDVVAGRLSWHDLRREVASLQRVLAEAGVGIGDRVVGFLPNTEHAIIGFLATAGLGAVWSSCSPDFGADAVLDRFTQIEPTVLIACRGYGYGGKYQDRQAVVDRLADSLPSLRKRIMIDLLDAGPLDGWQAWDSWPRTDEAPTFVRVAFGHPLWILFSSGTTGRPKAIVHGHGGCLVEHLKYLHLQADVRPGEHFFWFTTTGWMMWNFLQASLLVGAVPVLYDGSPGYPSLGRLWRLADELPIHHFGTSAPFIQACAKTRLDVSDQYPLEALRSIGSTGAPLDADGFDYVTRQVRSNIWLTSMSGGTDVCTAFVGGNPWRPVLRGWIQGRALGCDLHAYDDAGRPVVGEEGELVVRQPMPSMPVQFWGDDSGHQRHESYFAEIPGVWRHGDWITVAPGGEVQIHGRSDATLNRQGVRMGTAEIYRTLATFPEVADALIVNYITGKGEDLMPLYIVLAPGAELDDKLRQRIKRALREHNSPRHVPTSIEAVPDIPYTISGKKLETPVKRLLTGRAPGAVAAAGALRNPASLEFFAQLAAAKTA